MNDKDKDLIKKVLHSNIKLKRLYRQHLDMEEKLESLSHRSFLTNEEQMEAKLLKKKKLYAKDQMMNLLSGYH